AKILKGLGVVPGVTDIIVIHGGHCYALELKTESGRLTPIQIETQERMRAAGATVATATGLDEALAALARWRLLRPGYCTPAPLAGWPAQIASEVAAAPDRHTAQQLIEGHGDAIAALPAATREHLLATLQDALRNSSFATHAKARRPHCRLNLNGA